MKAHPYPIIHIIGLPGAGKTALGQQLSKKFGLPVFYIGTYRARYSRTAIGEADAWVALFRDLSRHGWKNCILETTGLNFREGFLRKALPLGQMMTVKLEASRKTLHKRIRMKKKSEQGGEHWMDDVRAVMATYREEGIPAVVERSRSGNGGHVWVFFSEEVPAVLARKLGSSLITKTMS
ncbi:MAG: hypothetical protein HQL23_03705 [Candidatus Omnitrophica bacterium]|nr:hypothetical protein [Candidatus Omnitrophota bacterium]